MPFPLQKQNRERASATGEQAGNRGTRENWGNNGALGQTSRVRRHRDATLRNTPGPFRTHSLTLACSGAQWSPLHPPGRPARDRCSCVFQPLRPASRNRPYDDTPETHPCTFIPAHQTRGRRGRRGLPFRGGRIGTETRAAERNARACVCIRARTRERTRGIRYSVLSQPGIVAGRISA